MTATFANGTTHHNVHPECVNRLKSVVTTNSSVPYDTTKVCSACGSRTPMYMETR